MKPFLGAFALVFVATTARAQVGHLPDNSPYRDLETRHEFTVFGGQYSAGRDAIGVAPRGEKGGTTDVNVVAKAEHRTSPRCHADRIPSGAVLPSKDSELVTSLQIAVGTVVRKVPDLRARGRGHKNNRKRAEERLH